MADFNGRRGPGRAILILGLVSLTLAVLAGIKFMMSDGSSSEPSSAAAEGAEIFSSPETGAPPPGLDPMARSGNPAGGSLDMFSKTNAGYYGEDGKDEEAAQDSAAAPAEKAVRSAAPGSAKTVAAPKPKTAATTVPRMKMVPFKSITPTNIEPSGTQLKQGMPDISTLMKQAREQYGGGGAGD